MGPDGDSDYSAGNPAAVYNSTNNEYLVVWQADDNSGGVVDNDIEIFGQRLSATGVEIGTNDFRISQAGPDGEGSLFFATRPDVTYNSATNEYLVVWEADLFGGGAGSNENEITGQRLSATGTEIGTNDFRISDMGPNGNLNFDAFAASVTYNEIDNQFLVVWTGDDNVGGLVDGEYEIFGQRLNTTGLEIGPNDFRISDMGPDGNTTYFASQPSVVHNTADNEYMIVWEGFDLTTPNIGLQIYGQRLSAAGVEVGINDFRLSNMEPSGGPTAEFPVIVFNPTVEEYMVVWQGHGFAQAADEFEIFGQRLNSSGIEIGIDDVRLSDMGPDGAPNYNGKYPGLTYGSVSGEYLVVWIGDDTLPNGFDVVFGQRFAPQV
jgi:hypothetical protein